MERRCLLGYDVHEGVMIGVVGFMAAAGGRGSRWSLLVSSKKVLVCRQLHLSPELMTMTKPLSSVHHPPDPAPIQAFLAQAELCHPQPLSQVEVDE